MEGYKQGGTAREYRPCHIPSGSALKRGPSTCKLCTLRHGVVEPYFKATCLKPGRSFRRGWVFATGERMPALAAVMEALRAIWGQII